MVMLLVQVLVVVIILGAILYIIQLLPLGSPFKEIAYVVVLIIFVIVLLSLVGLLPGRAALAYESYSRGYETPGHSHTDHYGQPGNGPSGKSNPGGKH